MDCSPALVIGRTHAAWADAFARRDSNQLAALYSRKAAFYGSVPQLYRGREGVRQYFTTLSPGYRSARFAEPSITVLTPTAFAASGPVEFTVQEGGVERIVAYRMTHVLALQDGTWLIAVHHASPVPR